MSPFVRKILLAILNAELDSERDELLQIAEAAGDTREQAIEWVMNDEGIQFLFACIERFSNYGHLGTSEAEKRSRRAQAQKQAEFARQDKLIADAVRKFKDMTRRK